MLWFMQFAFMQLVFEGLTPKNAFHLMRPADDPGLPWPGVIFGLTISSVWYWCSDQVSLHKHIDATTSIH